MTPVAGTGPGAITADGCAVEVYRMLGTHGEPELIAGLTSPGGRILDLGCGAGRVADPLALQGFDVVAVDNSAAMLACVSHARPLLGDLETLAIRQLFDTVLLCSHLANLPEQEVRTAIFGTAARHCVPGGTVVIEWHPPGWFDGLQLGPLPAGELDGLTSRLEVHSLRGDVLTATVSYAAGDEEWTQHFTARRLEVSALSAELAAVGLGSLTQLTDDGRWLIARR